MTSSIWDTIWSGLTDPDEAISSSTLERRILDVAGDREPDTDIAREAWKQLLTSTAVDQPAPAAPASQPDPPNPPHVVASNTKGPQGITLLHRVHQSLGYLVTTSAPGVLTRLYIGDLMWLYFYERMGVFRMLRRLIDDYSRHGRFPIEYKHAGQLETLTRLAQSGRASAASERAATYLRSLGWSCEGMQVPAGIQANLSFDSSWRCFLRNALAFYRGKSISNIISPTSGLSGASVVAACDSARSLWESLKPFETSSNYPATYYGLAWTIGTLRLIETKEIKNAIGVSDSTSGPAAISAAYEILVLGQPPRGTDSSRYLVHNDCAHYGRRILLDLQGLRNNKNRSSSDLTTWLSDPVTESNIEGFRSAWQRLTGEDLSPAVPIAVSR